MSASTYQYGANIHANGIRQHYARYGGQDTVPLIVVPGITSPAPTWDFIAQRLGRQLDTYVVEARGRGLSETRDDLDYTLDSYADDLAAFASEMGFERYNVLGHSMGARIGIRFARSKPAGLNRLVLVDPPVTGPGRRAYPTPLSWYVDSIRLMTKGGSADDLLPFSPTWTLEQRAVRAEWLHTCNEKAITDTYNDFHESDIHADLPQLECETLLLVAGQGGVILPEDEEEIRSLLPSIMIRRVETAGHMIPWDDFDGFFEGIGDFLGPKQI